MITIRLQLGDALYTIEPQEDITPLESTHLNIFLIVATNNIGVRLADRVKYIHAHNLWRHLKEENKDETDT